MLIVIGVLGHTTSGWAQESGFQPLFPDEGVPKGWTVRRWDDISLEPEAPANWQVKEGVLTGGLPRGTWLMSEREYGDFELMYEFKLGPQGNSGLAVRAPLKGDPAFDGIEVQMADLRYNPQANAAELTGGLYRALAPNEQVYRPEEWNRLRIKAVGSRVEVELNGKLIQQADLEEQTDIVKRHDGTDAPPLKDRPRSGHLGFQELSRGDSQVQIRKAQIRVLTSHSTDDK